MADGEEPLIESAPDPKRRVCGRCRSIRARVLPGPIPRARSGYHHHDN